MEVHGWLVLILRFTQGDISKMDSNQPIPINTTIAETPQLQTVVQDGLTPVTSVINAPWVSVTSVNGKTGDVAITSQVVEYQKGVGYSKGDIVSYNGELYYATSDFVGGNFNPSQWKSFSDTNQQQANWAENNVSVPSYIQNKPTKVSSFTNDAGYTTSSVVDTKISTSVSSAVSSLNTQIAALDSSKVDKVSGLGLSENSFTTAEKAKLSNLADIQSIGEGLDLSGGVLSTTNSDKLYNITFTASAGYTLTDASFTPTLGSHIYVKTSTASTSAYCKLRVNSGSYLPIQSPPIGTAGVATNVAFSANCVYELVYLNTYWQCLNAFPAVSASGIASGAVGGFQLNWTDLKNKYYYWDDDYRATMPSWTKTTMKSTTISGLEVSANYYYIATVAWVEAPGDAEIIVDVNGNNPQGTYTTYNGLRGITMVGQFYSGNSVTLSKRYNGTAGSVRYGPISILFLRASY